MSNINFKNGYFYSVCLICVILFIFSTVSLVNTLVDIAYPPQKIEPQSPIERSLRYKKEYPNLPSEEIKQLITEQEKRNEINGEYRRKRRNILELARAITLLILTVPIYIFHWNKIKMIS